MFKKYFCCYKKLSEHLASGGISDVDKELLRYERYLKIHEKEIEKEEFKKHFDTNFMYFKELR